jgi:hypothetical protein
MTMEWCSTSALNKQEVDISETSEYCKYHNNTS